jgi:hypothetical protein
LQYFKRNIALKTSTNGIEVRLGHIYKACGQGTPFRVPNFSKASGTESAND